MTPLPENKWPQWDCRWEGHKTPITVGDPILLICNGDFIETIDAQKAHFVFTNTEQSKNQKYALHLLDIKYLKNKNATLVVTSYQTGSFENFTFALTDGNSGFASKPLRWQVQSVQDPQKPVEAFGPFGPALLPLPLWFWAVWGVPALFVLAYLFLKLKQYWQRRKILDELSLHRSSLSPFSHFQRELRSLKRKLFHGSFSESSLSGLFSESSVTNPSKVDPAVAHPSKVVSSKAASATVHPSRVDPSKAASKDFLDTGGFVIQLDSLLREYLKNTLLLPAFRWRDTQILKEIRRRHKTIDNVCADELKKTLRELEHAKQTSEQVSKKASQQAGKQTSKQISQEVSLQDCEQLAEMCRQLVNKIERVKQQTGKNTGKYAAKHTAQEGRRQGRRGVS